MADRMTPIHSGYSMINGSFSGTATAKLGCWMEYKVVSQSVENNTSTIRFYIFIANVAASAVPKTRGGISAAPLPFCCALQIPSSLCRWRDLFFAHRVSNSLIRSFSPCAEKPGAENASHFLNALQIPSFIYTKRGYPVGIPSLGADGGIRF
ncbi:MAG: hypothetical protein IKG85_00875 [Clostridia bacterium]|nr:hypothetical protein [Clostridia bacterium]